jgi:hypothetical protein
LFRRSLDPVKDPRRRGENDHELLANSVAVALDGNPVLLANIRVLPSAGPEISIMRFVPA